MEINPYNLPYNQFCPKKMQFKAFKNIIKMLETLMGVL